MSNLDFIIHLAINYMQRANDLLLHIAGDLPIVVGLDDFDAEQLCSVK
jgi:hypothetical protein